MPGGNPRRRAAVVVIHGIGDQPPLRTLGAFAQGLVRAAAARAGTHARARAVTPAMRPASAYLAGRPRAVVRIDGEGLGLPFDDVDVLEYHWAEHALGRIGALSTFAWLLGTALAALDFRRQLPFLLAHGVAKAWPAVLRQLLWVTSLAALAAGLVVAGLAAVARGGAALAAAREAVALLPPLGSLPTAAALVLFACFAIATLALGRDVVLAQFDAARVRRRHPGAARAGDEGHAAPRARSEADTALRARGEAAGAGRAWSGMYGAAARRWAPAGTLTFALALAATVGLAWLVRPALARYAEAVGALMAEPGVAIGVAVVAAGLVARTLLLSHVGDIALYVTSDRISSRARTRRAVLDEGQMILQDLLTRGGGTYPAGTQPAGPAPAGAQPAGPAPAGTHPAGAQPAETHPAHTYDAVYVAGHSLGSVIALDLLDRIASESRHREVPLERVRGLLTFGSPLDKVAYFFRQRPDEGEAVRTQLLSYLHGVRRRRNLRDYGPYTFAPYQLPFADMSWLHVHAPADPLSDRLLHYRVNRLVTLPRLDPFTAHNAYWRDDRFYRAALAWLGGSPVGEVVDDPAPVPRGASL
ncbi:MAG: hypothetical protein R6W77_05135 [Trueperaceae bacterium]